MQPRADLKSTPFNRTTNETSRPPPASTPTPADLIAELPWSWRHHGDGGGSRWRREVGVGERELGRSLLQRMGPKGSFEELGWGCGRGGGAAPTCLARLPASPGLTFPPLPLTHHAGDSQHLGCKPGRGGAQTPRVRTELQGVGAGQHLEETTPRGT